MIPTFKTSIYPIKNSSPDPPSGTAAGAARVVVGQDAEIGAVAAIRASGEERWDSPLGLLSDYGFSEKKKKLRMVINML